MNCFQKFSGTIIHHKIWDKLLIILMCFDGNPEKKNWSKELPTHVDPTNFFKFFCT